MRSVKIALAAGIAITGIATARVLSESPLTVLASNSIPVTEALALPWSNPSVCQAGERLPAGTVAIRLSVAAVVGPAVRVTAVSGSHIRASGEQQSGWTGNTVTVPVRRVAETVSPAEICFAADPSSEAVGAFGSPTSPQAAARTSHGEAFPGRLRIEYMTTGHRSWLALASLVAGHMAFGRAWSGKWVVFLVAILMLVVAVLVSQLILRELGRKVVNTESATARPARSYPARSVPRRQRWASRLAAPRIRSSAAWGCALVACLNAASWSFITPPFQVTDEPSHFAYVKQLAETGTLPTSGATSFSSEEQYALTALESRQIRKNVIRRAIFSQAQQTELDDGLETFNRSGDSKGSPAAGVAATEPPLYYALASIPYSLASGGTLLERLQLMRLLSALIAGATALFTFLFLREALPRVRWAWTVGGLAVALSPLFAFMSGGVNPDSLLIAVSAALLYCLARAFRRGLTSRSALALGLVIVAGLLTKLNFIGLLPGALLAPFVLAVSGVRRGDRHALRAPAIAIAIGLAPIVVFIAHNILSKQSVLGIVTSSLAVDHGSLLARANYIWQLYLPRLPGTVNDFAGVSTTGEIWFNGYVGRLGWLDTRFPDWVYSVALGFAGAILALCACGGIACRSALRRRAPELAIYALMTLGLLVLIGMVSYGRFPKEAAEYGQARYLLPLIPLLGAVVALAARAAGRRWGPVLGTVIVVLVFAHDLFSQLQVIARYYG